MRVSVRVEAVVQVVEHVDDVISLALGCDVCERHNVTEQNCAAFVPLCNKKGCALSHATKQNCAAFDTLNKAFDSKKNTVQVFVDL